MPAELTEAQALRNTRIVWGFLFISHIALSAVLLSLVESMPEPDWVMEVAIVGVMTFMALLGLPIAFITRLQIYKYYWQANCVRPQGYQLGNVIFLGILDGLVLLCVMGVVISGRWFPLILLVLILLFVHLKNYPHGQPMRSVLPDAQTPNTDT